jgi:hypothetical protein
MTTLAQRIADDTAHAERMRLAGAAPDMLAALTYAAGKLSAFADAETDDQESWIIDDIERVVRAAIAKATGEEI